MDAVLVKEILAWAPANLGCHLGALTSHLSYKVNRRLSEDEVNTALSWMHRRGLLERKGDEVWLSEPDRPELDLYPSLSKQLMSAEFLADLGVDPGSSVFQKTALGGRTGDGRLTRPDFTLATVRSGRFDRALDVYTFEVKNRSGASLPSVYEVVAHGRLAHFPYLVCPRSVLEPQKSETIRVNCMAQGVGLVLFDIVQDDHRKFSTDAVTVDVRATRKTPSADAVQNYLEKRLSSVNCDLLERLVKGE